MERIERDPRDSRELSFTFKEPERSGRVVFELQGGRIEVPGRVLLEPTPRCTWSAAST